MQIQRTSMAQAVETGTAVARPATTPTPTLTPTPVPVATGGGSPAGSPGTPAVPQQAAQQPRPEQAHKPQKADPSLSAMSSTDRAVIASATGFFISPTGEVTPDGMPPWSFIMQTLEKRHKADTPAEPTTAAAPATAAAAEGVDVTV